MASEGCAVERSGQPGALIIPWTKQILNLLWQHVRLLVHVIYLSFMAVFQMFRLEVHLRITDETGHHIQHVGAAAGSSESFLLSSLFDGENGVITAGSSPLSKCGLEAEALLSSLHGDELCRSLVDDFVLRAAECFSDSGEDLCVGRHQTWTMFGVEDTNGEGGIVLTPFREEGIFEPETQYKVTENLEEVDWDEDDDENSTAISQESQALWESFRKSSDPYNPLFFSACISTHPNRESKSQTLIRKPGKISCPEEAEESLLENPFKKRALGFYQQTSDSGSDWDSSESEGQDEVDEKNKKLWELFHPADPYNPFCFTASTCSSTQTKKERDLESDCLDTDDDDLWNSFMLNGDPYHPLNFRACIQSSLPPQAADKPMVQMKDGLKRMASYKPHLPERHFKHYCPKGLRIVPWKKSKPSSRSASNGRSKVGTFKKVHFSPVVHVHMMRVWQFALQASRRGPWERLARDRDRFQRRIWNVEHAVGYCLLPAHREKMQTYIRDCEEAQLVFLP